MTNTTTTTTTPLRLLQGTSVLAVATGLTALGLTPAAAHVSAASTSTAAGGYSQVTFSVPNESDAASTNKLELTLPVDTPFASVRVKPVEGWSAQVTEAELPEPVQVGEGAITKAASTITWTAAEEHAIDPGEFQTFTISVGPLPEEGTTLVLPVTQSYTDGRSVAWDQPATEGQAEPEHPAPSLTITAAEADGQGHGTEDPAAAQPTTAPEEASTQAPAGTALSWAGLIAGLLGLTAGVTALIRTRHRG